jgi:hypothetical protein
MGILPPFRSSASFAVRRRFSRVLFVNRKLARIAFANMLDYLNVENGRSSEYPEPTTTACENELITSISLLYVCLTDKGDDAGVHPYNRILACA